MIRPRWHWATIAGRLRSDTALLILMGLVIALTTMLTAVVAPLGDRAADRTIAAVVRSAGGSVAVVATSRRDREGPMTGTRDPRTAEELRREADDARSVLPARLDAILGPSVTTVSTSALQLLDAGTSRTLQLTYVDTPSGAPATAYVAGRAPEATGRPSQADIVLAPDVAPWPVQVAVSEPVAQAFGVGVGDRLSALDDEHRMVRIRISGVYTAADPQSAAWQGARELLAPVRGTSEGVQRIAGAALVSAASLPDLRLALPPQELAHHITFMPRPSLTRWHDTAALTRELAYLQAAADTTGDGLTWDSLLGRVLADARDQVAAAQGQAQVILVGLLICAFLVLALAARLLVERRAGPLTIARERGASLPGIALELFVEALLVAAIGAALGLAVARLLAGDMAWTWSVPLVVAAVAAAPVYGAILAARATSVRRVPANRSARRALDRARRVRRLTSELAVVAAAALSLAALHQRGVVRTGGSGSLTGAVAAPACAIAGTVIGVRLLAPALRLSLRAAQRSVDGVRLLVAARLSQTAARTLPLLAVTAAVAQLTFGVALAATEHRGQEAGALLAVGGDARLTTDPDPRVATLAHQLADEPGVRAATSALVADDVPVISRRSTAAVRLVVVDAVAYRQLLAASALPDAPELTRLNGGGADGDVPALLLGGGPDLRDAPVLHRADTAIRLDVVGDAPRVDGSIEPVLVVDAGAFARAGASATPNTVWATGPGAADALQRSRGASDVVATYAEELETRQHAPLAAALVRLAIVSCVPLLLFAILGIVLAAATEAPERSQSVGRLRSLGMADADLRRVLAGELLTTAALAALAGLALGILGVLATFGSLSLERITGQGVTPHVIVPWWTPILAGAVVLSALVTALAEWRRLRRRVLAQLLRS